MCVSWDKVEQRFLPHSSLGLKPPLERYWQLGGAENCPRRLPGAQRNGWRARRWLFLTLQPCLSLSWSRLACFRLFSCSSSMPWSQRGVFMTAWRDAGARSDCAARGSLSLPRAARCRGLSARQRAGFNAAILDVHGHIVP